MKRFNKYGAKKSGGYDSKKEHLRANQLKFMEDAFNLLCKLVSYYEGLHDGDLRTIGLQPKMCPAGYWTEGYGQVVTDDKGKMIKGIENKSLAYKFSKC